MSPSWRVLWQSIDSPIIEMLDLYSLEIARDFLESTKWLNKGKFKIEPRILNISKDHSNERFDY